MTKQGRRILHTTPTGATTHYEYDAAGRRDRPRLRPRRQPGGHRLQLGPRRTLGRPRGSHTGSTPHLPHLRLTPRRTPHLRHRRSDRREQGVRPGPAGQTSRRLRPGLGRVQHLRRTPPPPNPAAWVVNPFGWLDPLGLQSCDDEIPKARKTFDEAKAEALRDAGIPEGAEPVHVDEWTEARGPEWAGNKKILGDDGKPIFYTEEMYEHLNGIDYVVFQDHWFGHRNPGEPGYQPPHVHVRPDFDTRNGQLPRCQEHYYYDR